MVHSVSRRPPNRKSKIAQAARGRGRRPNARTMFLTVERFEDRILLSEQPASATQMFNLSNNTDYGTLYLQEDMFSKNLQYSTDGTSWSTLLNIGTGTGPITINESSLQAINSSLNAGDVVISGNIYTNGRDFEIDAQGSIWVKPNVVISTQSTAFTIGGGVVSQANSGSLTLDVENPPAIMVSQNSPSITIDTGAQLLANAINSNGSNYTSGNVTLTNTASEISLNVPILTNFGADYSTSSIDLNQNAIVKGANVTINATAGDVNPLNTLAQDIGGTAGSAVSGLLQFITGAVTSYLSLPISVQLKAPNSEVTVGTGASITSSGSTSIVSEADADASGEAVFHADVSGFGGSFGFQWSSPKATTTIDSNATITAGGLVNVESTVTSTSAGVARVTQNAGPGFLANKTVAPFSERFGLNSSNSGQGPQNTDPNRIQVSGSVAVDELTSITTVSQGASITSNNNVTVQALGQYTGSSDVETASYFDGRAGIAFAVGYSSSNVQAVVDGNITVTGGGGATGGTKEIFNPYKDVNFANSTIHFDTPDGFAAGDTLTYSSADGTAIPGLVSGTTYYVIVVDSQTIKLAASLSDAQNGTAISFGQFPTLTDGTLVVPITDINDITGTIEYAYDTGINPGDQVKYTAVGGEAIGGLVSGNTYTVVAGGDPDNSNAFQLKDSSGNLVQFDTYSTVTWNGTTSLNFILGTDPNTIDLRGQEFTPVIDTASNTIDLGYAHGFTNGEQIVYDNGGGTSIPIMNSDGSTGALVEGGTYVAVVDPAFPTRLGLEDLSGNRITLLDPGATSLGSEQRFTPLAATQIQTGDSLTYHGVLGLNITGLVDGTTYYAIANPYNPGVYYLATNASDANSAYSNGQVTYNSAYSTFMQGVYQDAYDYYLATVNPGGTDPQADAYANGIVQSDGNSVLQIYLNENPGAQSLWFAAGVASARNDGGTGTPIVINFSPDPTIMSGIQHSLTPGNKGITINAQLTASDTAQVASGIGSEPTISQALTQGELAPAVPGLLQGGLQTIGTMLGLNDADPDSFTNNYILQNLPKSAPTGGQPAQPITPNAPNFTIVGAFGLLITNNNVLADIGPDAVLKTNQSITINSTDTDTTDINVNAGLSKPDNSTENGTTQLAIAAGISVGVFGNSASTEIEDGAILDATQALTATSSVTYPFLFPTSAAAAATTFGGGNIISTIGNFLGGQLGLSNYLFNNWVHAGQGAFVGDTSTPGTTGTSIAGSIGVDVYTNSAQESGLNLPAATAQTLVGNALINQDPTYRNPSVAQTVSFDASTTIDTVDMTGIADINLSPAAIAKQVKQGGSALFTGNAPAQKGSAGGSLFVTVANDTTTTQVSGGAQIYTSMPAADVKTFTPTVDTTNNTIDLGYNPGFTTGEPIFYDNSGPPSTDIGGLQRGHVYYAIVNPSQPTKIRLASSLPNAISFSPEPIALTSGGSGPGQSFTPASLSVTAESSNIQASLVQAGAQAGNWGLAASFGVLVYTDKTTAQVESGAQITGPATGGDVHGLNIDAHDATLLINLGGSVETGSSKGFGFTATVNVLDRTTLSLLGANPNDSTQTPFTSSINLGGDLGINAQNAGTLVAASVAAAVQTDPDNEGDEQQAAGSKDQQVPSGDKTVSWGDTTDIATSQAQGIGGVASGLNISGSGGTVGAAAGSDGGIGVSGDGSLNEIVNDTADAIINEKAAVASPSNPNAANIVAGNVTVTADNETVALAVAGAAAVMLSTENSSNTAIAGSFTQDTLIGDTEAYISGAVIHDAGDMTVDANRGGYIGALSAGAAAAAGTDSKGIDGSFSVNIITDKVKAYLTGSTVTVVGDLDDKATDSTLIVSVAGGVGYGGKAGAGIAIAVNVITDTAYAYVNSSNVTDSGGGVEISATNEGPSTDARIVALTGTVGASSQGGGGAGMLSVNIVENDTEAYVGNNSTITDTAATSPSGGTDPGPGNLLVHANDTSEIVSIGGAVGIGQKNGVGVALGYNGINSQIKAYIDSSTVTVPGTLTVNAESHQTIGAAEVGGGGSSGGWAIAGSLGINIITDGIDAHISNSPNVQAGGAVSVTSSDQSLNVGVVGALAVSLSKGGIGASISYNRISNGLAAYIDASTVTSQNSTVTVSATSTPVLVAVGAAGGGSGGNSVGGAGTLTINSIANTVDAHVTGGSVVSGSGDVSVTSTEGATEFVAALGAGGSSGGTGIGDFHRL